MFASFPSVRFQALLVALTLSEDSVCSTDGVQTAKRAGVRLLSFFPKASRQTLNRFIHVLGYTHVFRV